MPRFRKLEPNEVHVGRGAIASIQRAQFMEAIKDAQAGRIDLEEGDNPAVVKRRLREAAQELGFKVRSSWADEAQTTLFWKRTGI